MTTEQPLALKLADKTDAVCERLRRTSMPIADIIPHIQAQADELHRLHAENLALRSALRQHIRTYQVDDQHWEPEQEADRLMTLALARAGEKT